MDTLNAAVAVPLHTAAGVVAGAREVVVVERTKQDGLVTLNSDHPRNDP